MVLVQVRNTIFTTFSSFKIVVFFYKQSPNSTSFFFFFFPSHFVKVFGGGRNMESQINMGTGELIPDSFSMCT